MAVQFYVLVLCIGLKNSDTDIWTKLIAIVPLKIVHAEKEGKHRGEQGMLGRNNGKHLFCPCPIVFNGGVIRCVKR